MLFKGRGKYALARIFVFIPHNDLLRFTENYGGERPTGHPSHRNRYLFNAFGQLTHPESPSDTMTCTGADTENSDVRNRQDDKQVCQRSYSRFYRRCYKKIPILIRYFRINNKTGTKNKIICTVQFTSWTILIWRTSCTVSCSESWDSRKG